MDVEQARKASVNQLFFLLVLNWVCDPITITPSKGTAWAWEGAQSFRTGVGSQWEKL